MTTILTRGQMIPLYLLQEVKDLQDDFCLLKPLTPCSLYHCRGEREGRGGKREEGRRGRGRKEEEEGGRRRISRERESDVMAHRCLESLFVIRNTHKKSPVQYTHANSRPCKPSYNTPPSFTPHFPPLLSPSPPPLTSTPLPLTWSPEVLS